VCASIANEIFLNKVNKEIFREELKKASIYNALNTIIKSGELKDKARTSIKRTKNRFRGGMPTDFWSIIKNIRDKTTTLYSSIKKLQISPPINTQPIGDLNLFNGESFSKVNKLDFPIIKKKSLTDHGMNGYCSALKKHTQIGGKRKTKRRRSKKKRKTKKKLK
jgi:hypothetical protein